ncbi:MAG: Butyrate kinase 2 [Firmicutes bacterium ADurb.Bin506]|nr:MAG: Butyrate kinase 2 [Firmicutes bacterium ADurb.Bin506]
MHCGAYTILAINPGSTSTKLAVYRDDELVFSESVSHSEEDLSGYAHIVDQLDMRRAVVERALAEHGVDIHSLSAVACRGGRLKPLASGTYLVNERMLHDAERGVQGEHASNLACLIGYGIARQAGIEAYIVDPVSVDELDDVARICGVREIQRNSLSHALNMKAVARRAARDIGKSYDEARIIVAHIGGGGSLSAHAGGRMIEINNCDKEGPFSAERAGAIPSLDLVDLCFSGRYTRDEVVRMLVGGGGLMSHLGTKDGREVERRIDAGDRQAELVYSATIYGFSKAIGSMAAVLCGKVDVVAVTGGMARSRRLTDGIAARTSFIAPMRVYPGEDELEALALGVLRVLRNEELPAIYE